MNGNGWWKVSATSLAGIVVGLLSFFFLDSRQHVTADEVRRIIMTENPYMMDKGKIDQSFSYTGRALDQMSADQRAVLKELTDLRLELKQLSTKVDDVTDSVHGRARGR